MDARITEFAVADAKARFSELLTRAEAGEEITIKRHGSAVAKIVPVPRLNSLEERLRRDEEYFAWLDKQGSSLPPGMTLKDMINEGRQF